MLYDMHICLICGSDTKNFPGPLSCHCVPVAGSANDLIGCLVSPADCRVAHLLCPPSHWLDPHGGGRIVTATCQRFWRTILSLL